MSLKFNIDRPKVSYDEIQKQKDFKTLVERFKKQSIKQAQGDESWWKNKVVRYSTIIAGVTVVCTITYLSLFNKQENKKANDKIVTQKLQSKHNNLNTADTPSTAKRKAFIQAPSEKLRTGYAKYTVNNSKGGKITHPSSSKITVPKNSFIDKSGKSIVGDVTIEYKEFHDMGDVIANGIPMAYDSAGIKYNLETAGMFDIRGYQNGEPVFIAPAKTVDVELASATAEQRFNQYYLDTVACNWKYLKRDKAVKSVPNQAAPQPQAIQNSKVLALKNEIEKVIPRKIDSVKVVYTSRINKLPAVREPAKPAALTKGRPTFKLDGSYDEFPELSAFNNVLFEVGPENRNYCKELHEITWSDVKVSQGPVKGSNYLLTLKYRNRVEKLVVYPVLSGNDLEQAKLAYADKFENYQKQAEKSKAEEDRLLKEMEVKQRAYLAEQKKKQEQLEKLQEQLRLSATAMATNELNENFNKLSIQVKAVRLFKVSAFGVFNSDCPHPTPKGTSVIPTFVLDDKGKPLQPEIVYLIDHSNKTVYTLDRSNGFQLKFDPITEYSFCVVKKNQLFVCRKDQFKNTTAAEKTKFTLLPLEEKADNIVDFKKALEI